jgi:hypothetical protein
MVGPFQLSEWFKTRANEDVQIVSADATRAGGARRQEMRLLTA